MVSRCRRRRSRRFGGSSTAGGSGGLLEGRTRRFTGYVVAEVFGVDDPFNQGVKNVSWGLVHFIQDFI